MEQYQWNIKESGTNGREEPWEEGAESQPVLFKLADGGGDFDVLAFLQSLLALNEIGHSIDNGLNQLDLKTR